MRLVSQFLIRCFKMTFDVLKVQGNFFHFGSRLTGSALLELHYVPLSIWGELGNTPVIWKYPTSLSCTQIMYRSLRILTRFFWSTTGIIELFLLFHSIPGRIQRWFFILHSFYKFIQKGGYNIHDVNIESQCKCPKVFKLKLVCMALPFPTEHNFKSVGKYNSGTNFTWTLLAGFSIPIYLWLLSSWMKNTITLQIPGFKGVRHAADNRVTFRFNLLYLQNSQFLAVFWNYIAHLFL